MDLVRGYRFFSQEECKKLIQYCDEKDKELSDARKSDSRNDEDGNTAKQPITQQYHMLYNFFGDHPQYIDRLVTCVEKVLPEVEFPIAVQSWVNVYRKGQGVAWHSHAGKSGQSFSANIFLQGPTKPGIYYSVHPEDVFVVENEVGSMHLFPNNLNHMVPPNESQRKRYTVGITIHGLPALDKSLIQGSAVNAANRETIILSSSP